MPTVGDSNGKRPAMSMTAALDVAVVAIVMTRSRSAAAARWSTSLRSPAKRSSSRWACVSISVIVVSLSAQLFDADVVEIDGAQSGQGERHLDGAGRGDTAVEGELLP